MLISACGLMSEADGRAGLEMEAVIGPRTSTDTLLMKPLRIVGLVHWQQQSASGSNVPCRCKLINACCEFALLFCGWMKVNLILTCRPLARVLTNTEDYFCLYRLKLTRNVGVLLEAENPDVEMHWLFPVRPLVTVISSLSISRKSPAESGGHALLSHSNVMNFPLATNDIDFR